MADLVEIAFSSKAEAEEVRQKLLMQTEYLIELEDAVIAIKQSSGHMKLSQLMNLTAAGAASGTLWSALIGFIFMPLLARPQERWVARLLMSASMPIHEKRCPELTSGSGDAVPVDPK